MKSIRSRCRCSRRMMGACCYARIPELHLRAALAGDNRRRKLCLRTLRPWLCQRQASFRKSHRSKEQSPHPLPHPPVRQQPCYLEAHLLSRFRQPQRHGERATSSLSSICHDKFSRVQSSAAEPHPLRNSHFLPLVFRLRQAGKHAGLRRMVAMMRTRFGLLVNSFQTQLTHFM